MQNAKSWLRIEEIVLYIFHLEHKYIQNVKVTHICALYKYESIVTKTLFIIKIVSRNTTIYAISQNF